MSTLNIQLMCSTTTLTRASYTPAGKIYYRTLTPAGKIHTYNKYAGRQYN